MLLIWLTTSYLKRTCNNYLHIWKINWILAVVTTLCAIQNNGSRIIFQQSCMKKLLRKSMIWADIVIAKCCLIAMKIMI